MGHQFTFGWTFESAPTNTGKCQALLERGVDIRTVQEVMGNADVKTIMIYLHVMNRPGLSVISPLDRLLESKAKSESQMESID